MDAERNRLEEARTGRVAWRRWGPYLSERQWGTVREDYSASGSAWDYFSHDQARSRAYRWGEDGLAGICDDQQRLCLALALWNGADPILKERLFGLTNGEGNHGEDVKEYYFYVDSTPTHAYMKYLYKYPQQPFPYVDLIKGNQSVGRQDREYELLDTGVFDDDRYFDVFVEYGKETAEDILIRITVENRGAGEAALDVLPTLWFRNTWTWDGEAKPSLCAADGGAAIRADHADLGSYVLDCAGAADLLFTENETNTHRLFGAADCGPYVKDGINDFIVDGRQDAVNPERTGTKAAARYRLTVAPHGTAVVRIRLRRADAAGGIGQDFDAAIDRRRQEADAFYASLKPPAVKPEAAEVMRQGLAGMLWSKQFYFFDLHRWLREHGMSPDGVRNSGWFHMLNADVISMPDKWEYPWYAAWDLAFHAIALEVVDRDFAKAQLELMLNELYLHPNGQIPAYEWNFSDVNPPVHAWATMFVYKSERAETGHGDIDFLKRSFAKLLLNFTWWVNRKDPAGRNVFEGGFLGLDNIGVFDRNSPLPTGGRLEQADGTAWMALFCQNMLEMALELALHDPIYEDYAAKFAEHFLMIAGAMDRIGDKRDSLWDEEDGFFYDLIRLPDGGAMRLKVRSLVGLLPLCAATVIDSAVIERYPRFLERVRAFVQRNPELTATIAPLGRKGVADRHLLSILDENKLRRVLARMLDPEEFLSDYGIRSLSRRHHDQPYEIEFGGQVYRVEYEPAESSTGMFGGNSNWRGPVWMPANILVLRALLQLYSYYGDDFRVECPTGSGQMMTLFEVAKEISDRLIRIFLRDETGCRPVYGGAAKFQQDPHWRDLILFYEYFHGDNGAGIGASHQTGWTGLVARLIQLFGSLEAARVLETGPGLIDVADVAE